MVKNVSGGSKQKKVGRKFANMSTRTSALRTSENDLEVYAVVTRMLGNSMFECHGIDDIVRLAYIRRRFTGKNKRHNLVVVGGWVLVGDREWSVSAKPRRECDLMEVYSEDQKKQLMDQEACAWGVLHAHDVTRDAASAVGKADDVYFTTDRDEQLDKIMADTTCTIGVADRACKDAATESELDQICVDDI